MLALKMDLGFKRDWYEQSAQRYIPPDETLCIPVKQQDSPISKYNTFSSGQDQVNQGYDKESDDLICKHCSRGFSRR